LRVAFAGTPPFAATALAALDRAGHEIVLVLTQPDRPAGRGLKVASSAVAQWAEGREVPLYKPQTLKSTEAAGEIRAARPDVMVVAAYGLLLPGTVLEIPPHGCLNIHASLLPRWRGAAPIQRALLAGDLETGISIMRMEAGLDTGPVLLTKSRAIGPGETAGTLTQALADLGAEAIVEALERLSRLEPKPQDPSFATYAAKVAKSEARIDWNAASETVDRQIRAFNPKARQCPELGSLEPSWKPKTGESGSPAGREAWF
jgi:methionyl-tRNA formyltransferase